MFSPVNHLNAPTGEGNTEETALQGHALSARSPAPIRVLKPAHRQQVYAHLLALQAHDRYLRFGYAASDEHIKRYVDSLQFARDGLFGIFDRQLDLIAMAHLAYALDLQCHCCAEFGVSVSLQARGRGYGSQLFERAVVHARNEGLGHLVIHALSENRAMLHIVRKAGAVIEREGPETQAHLRLPPADFDSQVSELLNEQLARTHYLFRLHAKLWRQVLALLQGIRTGCGRVARKMRWRRRTVDTTAPLETTSEYRSGML